MAITSNAYWAPPYVKDVDTGGWLGDLYITNYRLALFVPTYTFAVVRYVKALRIHQLRLTQFQSGEEAYLALSMPLGCISKVEVGKLKDRTLFRKYYVEVTCKDFRVLRFPFSKSEKHRRDSIFNNLIESGYVMQSAHLYI